MSFQELAADLKRVFRRGVKEAIPDHIFNDLALRIFSFQCRENRAYGEFVVRRGVDPGRVTQWEEIPALPTRAFKSMALVAGNPDGVERVFRTSGTTLGRERKGEHHVLDLDLYRESLLPNFKHHLIPEEGEGLRILCLLPSPDVAPDSSLSFMMGEVVDGLAAEDSGFFVGPGGEIETETFWRSLQNAEETGRTVLVVGTAFAFVAWVDLVKEHGWRACLPPGSMIMETGGFKGRSRDLPRTDLYGSLRVALGVPENRIVNEYGMTELLSQFYEPASAQSREAGSGEGTARPWNLAHRFHRGPPWVRTRALEPLSLGALPQGEVGVLAHLDLANLGSVSAVLTEDLGREVPGGFQLLGRSPGSEPRGCSLAMEDFLASRKVKT